MSFLKKRGVLMNLYVFCINFVFIKHRCKIYPGDLAMTERKVMLFEADEKLGMRCRFISDWCKTVSYKHASGEGFLLEIKKLNPDVVFLALDLCARIDGTKTAQIIQCQYNIPVMYIR